MDDKGDPTFIPATKDFQTLFRQSVITVHTFFNERLRERFVLSSVREHYFVYEISLCVYSRIRYNFVANSINELRKNEVIFQFYQLTMPSAT